MPHSLRAKLSGLRYKGILEDKDYKRLCHALDLEKAEQEPTTRQSCDNCKQDRKECGNDDHYGFCQNWEYAEQEPTGHWILDETDNSITCDKCGCLIWANDISNGEAYYCPNCGARMYDAN